ncbi:MAG: quinone oxidoreductase [Rhizobiales bacterium]|nr:quinone oxidoreductase [Hyphomicrobiales bacterium]
MTHAIVIDQNGGPEVMRWSEVAVGRPGPGQALIRHTAIGVNFIDVYMRKGVYKAPGFPLINGQEGAGVVEAVGDGVTLVKPGDRVVYQGQLGAYAEERLVSADKLVKIPAGVDDVTAAASFLKGLTAWMLLRKTFLVEKGNAILFHAAAGGVGVIACQWAKALGATVIGTVGSDDKAAAARANGCDHVINYRKEDFAKRVREITGGEGVAVAYDSVGKDTFPGSLDSLAQRGMWVSFGQSSGVPPEFPISALQFRGSLFATRPVVSHYVAKRPDLEAGAAELFGVIASGAVKLANPRTVPLKDAAEAHRAVEARETVGSTVLIP